MADKTTLHAPRGATSEAGAKAKAAKLPTSPAAMRKVPIHHVGFDRNWVLAAEREDAVEASSSVESDAACSRCRSHSLSKVSSLSSSDMEL